MEIIKANSISIGRYRFVIFDIQDVGARFYTYIYIYII
ncbi:MAG: DUF1343 domain-containing protein [Bacteroidetes bacterium]|nr:DUF1343 domain-containing protein [Bacteroidota bacterium]